MITFGPAAFAAAFAAGFLSFLSPCVLPLVPGYLSLVSGVGFDEIAARPRRVVTSTLAFVAGFGSITESAQTSGVAYMAHVGGFVAGLVLAFLLRGSADRGIPAPAAPTLGRSGF